MVLPNFKPLQAILIFFPLAKRLLLLYACTIFNAHYFHSILYLTEEY